MNKTELIVEVKFHRRNNLALKNKSTKKIQKANNNVFIDITLSMVMNK